MILSRSKIVGLNLRRSEFTFHDSAPLNNLHSMLGRGLVFSGASTFHDSAPLINLAHLLGITHEFGMVNLRSLLNLDLIRPCQLNKLDNKQNVEWLISSKWYQIDIHLLYLGSHNLAFIWYLDL